MLDIFVLGLQRFRIKIGITSATSVDLRCKDNVYSNDLIPLLRIRRAGNHAGFRSSSGIVISELPMNYTALQKKTQSTLAPSTFLSLCG